MSIYVKKGLELMRIDPFCNKDRILRGILEYPNLTIKDLEYIYNNTTWMTNGIMNMIIVHPLVTFEWLMEHHDDEGEFLWNTILCNPNVTTKTVEKYPNYDWNWTKMHLVKDLHIDFILANLNERWNWVELASVIRFEDYLALGFRDFGLNNFEQEIIIRSLSSNKNITIQNVIDHPEIDWWVKSLLKNPSIQKDLTLDLILSQIGPNTNGTELFAFMLKFYVNEQPVSDELVEKMRQLPASLGADEWFFKSDKYKAFQFEQLSYINPEEITLDLLEKWPMEQINEKVANFHNKCETEIANVVVTHLDRGKETDCGIRQIIRDYL